MNRPPRPAGEPLVKVPMLMRISYVSLLLMGCSLGMFAWYRSAGATPELARTIAVNTLIIGEIFYLSTAVHSGEISFTQGAEGDPAGMGCCIGSTDPSGSLYIPPRYAGTLRNGGDIPDRLVQNASPGWRCFPPGRSRKSLCKKKALLPLASDRAGNDLRPSADPALFGYHLPGQPGVGFSPVGSPVVIKDGLAV